MKKLFAMILSLTMVLALAACGGETAPEAEGSGAIDLNAFYTELAEKYDWVTEENMDSATEESIVMMDLAAEPEFMDNYFPGLSEIATKQLIAKTSMISAVANECVFVECESEEDAAKVAEILQGRVTMQAEGGAWYPETIESWEKAEVITNGAFVGLIACAGIQSDVSADFNGLFA